MKKLLTAVIFFLALPATSRASQDFNIFFTEANPRAGAIWTGTYTITDGVVSAFSALVGGFDVEQWTFEGGINGPDPFDNILSSIWISTGLFPSPFFPPDSGRTEFQILTLFEDPGPLFPSHRYRIHTAGTGDHSGTYTAQAVLIPEASAWLLLGVGLIVFRVRSYR